MRPSIGGIRPAVGLFQSTHPVWDATDRLLRLLPTRGISIHASRMGCDRWKCSADRGRAISIHASRMGCDLAVTLIIHGRMHFNPRIPYGMRHAGRLDLNYFRGISIHASRMGCDAACRVYHRRLMDFNPRIPYGMRHPFSVCDGTGLEFQSTHPVWDATYAVFCAALALVFQSTHPVWDATARMDIAFHNMEIIARSSS